MKSLNNVLGGGGYAVSSQDLAAALKTEFDRIAGDEESGGLCSVAHLAASSLQVTGESVYRRIYGVRSGQTRSINAEMAEAITLAVGNWHLRELDIPTMPRSLRAAVESVEAWADVHEIDDPELDVLGLARKLFRFACGYCSTFADVEQLLADEQPEEEQEQAAVAELVAA